MTTRALPSLANFGDFRRAWRRRSSSTNRSASGWKTTTTLSTTRSARSYTLKPHRFQLDVAYFRDRFQGADTGSAVQSTRGNLGFQGQKTDSVLAHGAVGVARSDQCGRCCKAICCWGRPAVALHRAEGAPGRGRAGAGL